MQSYDIAISSQSCWIQSDKGIWDKPDLPTKGSIHRKEHLFFWALPKSSLPLTPARNFDNFFTFFSPSKWKGSKWIWAGGSPPIWRTPRRTGGFSGKACLPCSTNVFHSLGTLHWTWALADVAYMHTKKGPFLLIHASTSWALITFWVVHPNVLNNTSECLVYGEKVDWFGDSLLQNN